MALAGCTQSVRHHAGHPAHHAAIVCAVCAPCGAHVRAGRGGAPLGGCCAARHAHARLAGHRRTLRTLQLCPRLVCSEHRQVASISLMREGWQWSQLLQCQDLRDVVLDVRNTKQASSVQSGWCHGLHRACKCQSRISVCVQLQAHPGAAGLPGHAVHPAEQRRWGAQSRNGCPCQLRCAL